MSYDEFQLHVRKAGLKLNEFANLMQMTPTSLSNYRKKAEVPTHLAVIAVLLEEMTKHGLDFKKVLSQVEITPKKARGVGLGGFSSDN